MAEPVADFKSYRIVEEWTSHEEVSLDVQLYLVLGSVLETLWAVNQWRQFWTPFGGCTPDKKYIIASFWDVTVVLKIVSEDGWRRKVQLFKYKSHENTKAGNAVVQSTTNGNILTVKKLIYDSYWFALGAQNWDPTVPWAIFMHCIERTIFKLYRMSWREYFEMAQQTPFRMPHVFIMINKNCRDKFCHMSAAGFWKEL